MEEPLEAELAELEAELRRMHPAPVPARLTRRIAESVAAEDGSGRRRRALLWGAFALGTAAAAAILIVSHGRTPRSLAAPPGSLFKPVSAEAVITSARDAGEVILGDGTRARQIDESVVDTITWKDPSTNATLTWSVPREQVQLVPISYE